MRADVVCGVGCSFTQTNFAAPIPPGKRLVHITNDEDAMNKDYRCEVPVLGDARLVLQQLLAALQTQAGGPRAVDSALQEEIRATKAAWLAQWMPKPQQRPSIPTG
jgi:acetolactate synthase-1/2/3 large subunit